MMRLLDVMVADDIGMSRKEALLGPHHSVSQYEQVRPASFAVISFIKK